MLKAVYNLFHRHYHRRYHGIYKHAKQLFVFDMGLLVFSFIMFGASLYFFLWKPSIASQIEIRMSLGDSRIKSGETVTLTISYTNKSKKILQQPKLSVRLPDGFIVDKSKTPSIDNNDTFGLPDLAPGARGHSEVYGTYWTNIGSDDKIITTLSYKESDRSDRDQAYATMYPKLSGSVLSGELKIATSSLPGQTLVYQYALKNTGNSNITDLFLEKNGLIDPASTTIASGETRIVTSSVTTPDNNLYYFKIRPIVTANNFNFGQIENTVLINIFIPKITIKANFTEQMPYADTGSAIPVKISWKNDSSFPLLRQFISITSTPGVVDVLETQKLNHLSTKGSEITITPKDRTALSSGKPGSEDEFILKLKLLPSFENKPEDQKSLVIQPLFTAGIEAASEQNFVTPGNKLSVSLPSEVGFRSEARYYTEAGDQVGRGPLPPLIGQTTKYWIYSTVSNTTNPLRDTMLKFQLEKGVTFTGKQSVTIGPELIYDSKTNTVTWNYKYGLPENSESGFYFEVSINPNPEQLGQPLTLIKEAGFSAVDDIVNKEYNLSVTNLSNILNRNDEGYTNGAIVTAE